MKKASEDSFGGRVKKRLAEIGETQAWLARQLEVNEEAVSRWVNGSVRPQPKNLHGMAQVLGVTVPWLLIGATPDPLTIPEHEVTVIVRQAVDDAVKGVLDRLQDWLLHERVTQMHNASRRGEA